MSQIAKDTETQSCLRQCCMRMASASGDGGSRRLRRPQDSVAAELDALACA